MTDREFEQVVIKTIYANPAVAGKITPLLDNSWFLDPDHKYIANAIIKHNAQWGETPNAIEVKRTLTDERSVAAFDACMAIPDENVNTKFILKEIEEFVRRRLVKKVNDKAMEYCRTGNCNVSLADEMATAESFSFDDRLGVDFLEEPNFLFDGIVANEKIFPMGVQTMDDMIGGGVHENSLVLLMAPTNVGKTLMLCSMGASMLLAGKKVLYLTFEDPELKIYQRIAQNLMDLTQTQLKTMTRDNFLQRFDQMKQCCLGGRLKIKHNPEFTTNALMINSMLKELKEREHFEPDVILLDYIGCMIPNGYSKDMNDNTRLTQVAMQVRAIATTYHLPIVSAAQVNRGGYGSSDVGLDDAADSFGQMTKADAVFIVTRPPEMEKAGMYKIFLGKTRYGITGPTMTTIGVDTEKQRIYDLTQQQVSVFEEETSDTYMARPDAGPDVNDFI